MKCVNKALVVAVLAFILVASLAVLLLLTDMLLIFFYAVLGNQVYALTIRYTIDSSPDFTFTLAKTRIPIESVLSSYKIKELGESEIQNTSITLNVLVYVLNKQKQFQCTFTFEDAQPRQITIYLPHLSPSHESVTIEITGNYNQAPIEAGTKINKIILHYAFEWVYTPLFRVRSHDIQMRKQKKIWLFACSFNACDYASSSRRGLKKFAFKAFFF